ncbi:MAG: flavin reductase family protein [Lacibacter sp.]|jgi:flavin reductase (DIM6/NTAB) family NADH-FMN oxidoreductase RutF
MNMRKKPWNRTDLPVYASSSCHAQQHNMHILTYVNAISMQPKRFVAGIYHGTKTLELVQASGRFVLQLLAQQQYNLVNLLGKQSGNNIDKIERLQKRNLLAGWNDYWILKDALAVMELQVVHRFDAGDHEGFLCDVVRWKNLNDGTPLTLNFLRQKGLVRG